MKFIKIQSIYLNLILNVDCNETINILELSKLNTRRMGRNTD